MMSFDDFVVNFHHILHLFSNDLLESHSKGGKILYAKTHLTKYKSKFNGFQAY